ncbi:MAG: twin-arginine translocation signal domain-containing protein [Candidatus Omnitrophica bacterium]|nr:twin-arginine translocation signal domain-containing protein [Candidatus Omnitrophota bacterium]MBU4590592.1 twin-arginine translocation signal domain-containing protein [Candidatus Omnitrophota bacterium]
MNPQEYVVVGHSDLLCIKLAADILSGLKTKKHINKFIRSKLKPAALAAEMNWSILMASYMGPEAILVVPDICKFYHKSLHGKMLSSFQYGDLLEFDKNIAEALGEILQSNPEHEYTYKALNVLKTIESMKTELVGTAQENKKKIEKEEAIKRTSFVPKKINPLNPEGVCSIAADILLFSLKPGPENLEILNIGMDLLEEIEIRELVDIGTSGPGIDKARKALTLVVSDKTFGHGHMAVGKRAANLLADWGGKDEIASNTSAKLASNNGNLSRRKFLTTAGTGVAAFATVPELAFSQTKSEIVIPWEEFRRVDYIDGKPAAHEVTNIKKGPIEFSAQDTLGFEILGVKGTLIRLKLRDEFGFWHSSQSIVLPAPLSTIEAPIAAYNLSTNKIKGISIEVGNADDEDKAQNLTKNILNSDVIIAKPKEETKIAEKDFINLGLIEKPAAIGGCKAYFDKELIGYRLVFNGQNSEGKPYDFAYLIIEFHKSRDLSNYTLNMEIKGIADTERIKKLGVCLGSKGFPSNRERMLASIDVSSGDGVKTVDFSGVEDINVYDTQEIAIAFGVDHAWTVGEEGGIVKLENKVPSEILIKNLSLVPNTNKSKSETLLQFGTGPAITASAVKIGSNNDLLKETIHWSETVELDGVNVSYASNFMKTLVDLGWVQGEVKGSTKQNCKLGLKPVAGREKKIVAINGLALVAEGYDEVITDNYLRVYLKTDDIPVVIIDNEDNEIGIELVTRELSNSLARRVYPVTLNSMFAKREWEILSSQTKDIIVDKFSRLSNVDEIIENADFITEVAKGIETMASNEVLKDIGKIYFYLKNIQAILTENRNIEERELIKLKREASNIRKVLKENRMYDEVDFAEKFIQEKSWLELLIRHIDALEVVDIRTKDSLKSGVAARLTGVGVLYKELTGRKLPYNNELLLQQFLRTTAASNSML